MPHVKWRLQGVEPRGRLSYDPGRGLEGSGCPLCFAVACVPVLGLWCLVSEDLSIVLMEEGLLGVGGSSSSVSFKQRRPQWDSCDV